MHENRTKDTGKGVNFEVDGYVEIKRILKQRLGNYQSCCTIGQCLYKIKKSAYSSIIDINIDSNWSNLRGS